MVIDLILLSAIGGAFYFGFKSGAKHVTFPKFVEAMKAKFKANAT